jgi:hypothetical protein
MSFDPESFLNTDVQGEVSTVYTPIPAGEFPGVIDDVSAKEVVSTKNGNTYHFLEVRYTIDSEEVRSATGMDSPKARQSMILDFTEAGTLDLGKGKNVNLGKLLEATGLNNPAKPWNFQMLVGKAVNCLIKHRTADDGQIFAEVKAVSKL